MAELIFGACDIAPISHTLGTALALTGTFKGPHEEVVLAVCFVGTNNNLRFAGV
jgi:hypothetical protein